MKFCASCGSALEFFEFLDGELCSSCLKKGTEKQAPHPKKKEELQPGLEEISETILSIENNKMVLKSREGWVLWSAPVGEKHQLQTILNKAQRILQIRKRRNKKQTVKG